jgi:hypothetical protein
VRVVTIPFGYEELPPDERKSVVPICLPATDDDGRRISWGWFEAVDRVQTPLRNLARRVLDDVWRVSELTESAVKTVWRIHGEDFGDAPSARVYVQAKWSAQDLKAGSARDRRRLNIALDGFDESLRGQILTDPCDYGSMYGKEMDLAVLAQRLREQGLEDIEQILQLVRDGCTWKEIGRKMSSDPNVTQRRFRRWMCRARRILDSADKNCEELRLKSGA